MTYGELKVSQGTSDFCKEAMILTKHRTVERQDKENFSNLKDVEFPFWLWTSSVAVPTMSKLYDDLQFDEGEKEFKRGFGCILKRKAQALKFFERDVFCKNLLLQIRGCRRR